MADEEKSNSPPGEDAPPPSSFPLIHAINLLVILMTAGFLIYSKYLFKRPEITEDAEREKLAAIHASPTPPAEAAFVNFDSMTVNIQTAPNEPKPQNGTAGQFQGKLHYLTLSFSLEIKDASKKDVVEAVRPFIMDKLLSMLGKKPYHELTTIQGRYVLHSQLLDMANQIIVSRSPAGSIKEPLVKELYFTQFIVQ